MSLHALPSLLITLPLTLIIDISIFVWTFFLLVGLLLLTLVFELDELLEALLVVGDELLILSIPILYFFKFLKVYIDIVEDERLDLLVILFHDVLVQQLLFDLLDSLHIGIDNFSAFCRIAVLHDFAPPHLIKLKEKVQYEEWMSHVDEGKAYAALSFKIHGQVKVIILPIEVSVD